MSMVVIELQSVEGYQIIGKSMEYDSAARYGVEGCSKVVQH
jgi:hypothetical protein